MGHFALGYFAAKGIGKITHEDVNIPITWLISILPDVDVFIPWLEHRGPTHSLVIALFIFIPIIITSKKGFAYLAALATHSTIGDYFTAYGCQLLWPINSAWMKAPPPLLLKGEASMYLELLLFGLMIVLMLTSKRAKSVTP